MYKVLIIEENKEISDKLGKLIDWEQHGFQILGVVSNGIVGRAVMERQKPDIVLLSMSTMYLSGRGFIEAVENISYPFRIIQLYTRQNTLVKGDYPFNLNITLNRQDLNPQDIIRALEAAAADLTRSKQDNYDLAELQPVSTQLNNAILKILKGTTQEEYMKLARKFSFNLEDAQLCVIILYPLEDWCFDEKLLKQLSNIVKAVICQYDGGEVFITGNNRLGAVVKFKKVTEKYTQHLFFSFIAEKVCESIKNQMGIDVDCVMSEEACDILNVSKAYYEVQELEPYRYFKSGTFVLTRKYIKNNAANVSFGEIDSCLRTLHDAMCDLDHERLTREITNLYLSLIKSSVDTAVVKYTRERLSDIYHSYLDEYSLDIEPENTAAGGEQCFKVEQEYLKMRSVFSSLIIKASEKRENLHPIIRKSTYYIEHNYTDGITLQDVSKIVNVSAVYLSRLFRKELNTTFVDYMTRVRIERSKILMSSGSGKISEIAKSVGYNDEKYFCRVFNKVTGKSPSAYRKAEKLLNGSEGE